MGIKASNFLQSSEWADFQATQGLQAATVELTDGTTLRGFGTKKFGVLYWYFPKVAVAPGLIRELNEWVEKTGAAWWQIESLNELNLSSIGGQKIKSRQPSATWVVEVQKKEDALLAAMHQKTRYNINLAQRKGVVIREGKDANLFNRLMRETAKRDDFISYSGTYYEQFLQIPFVQQLTAWQGDQALATGLFVRYNETYTYVHGASHHEARAAMAPQLLQWEAIRHAQKLGCAQYDFWGIAPPATAGETESFHGYTWSRTHSLSGVTRFKVGFGGHAIEYPSAWQVVLKPNVHKLYSLIRRFV